jgi:DUF4097 and DUF4098 domain-containing protein YvlB
MNPFLFRRIRGPIFLLTFAVTALLNQWDILSFGQSWPLYLIVGGVLRLIEASLFLSGAAAVYGVGATPYPVDPYAGVRWGRRRSFTSGILLLLIGVFALLITTGTMPSFFAWNLYGTWWPLLLIVVGLLLLVERLFDRSYAQRVGNNVYVGRPRHGGGLVLLLFILIVCGVFSHVAVRHGGNDWWHWNNSWNNGDWNWGFSGETHTNTVSLSQAIPADAALTIDNGHGDLQIAPSSDGEIHVDATQVAHVADRRKDSAFAQTRPNLSVNGASATLTVPSRDDVSVRLAVSVPPGVLCTIHNHKGDIAISGLTRPLDINQDHGDVTLDSLGGSVHITMDHGDVHARAIQGDLSIDGRADDVTASNITGKTVLHGEFFGDTDLEQVQGPVDFDSNRTQLTVQHLTGDLTLDSGDLRVTGASGGLHLNTRSKDVEVTGLSGEAQITDRNGDITVAAMNPLGVLTLQNDTGDVTLSIPNGLSFSMNGSTGDDDDISSDFPFSQNSGGDTKTISGQVGQGGPHIEIHTRHGDLTLRSVAADPDRPEKPEKPEKPERPEKPEQPAHVKHLHATGETPAPVSE